MDILEDNTALQVNFPHKIPLRSWVKTKNGYDKVIAYTFDFLGNPLYTLQNSGNLKETDLETISDIAQIMLRRMYG